MIAGFLAYDAIVQEMTTLGDLQAIHEEAKVEVWKQSLPMLADFPLFGIGRGAFPSIFKRYQSGQYQQTFTHAENEALQMLVDWGPVLGGCILLGFIASFLLGLRRVRNSTCLAGCLVGIFGILCHNLVDFQSNQWCRVNILCGDFWYSTGFPISPFGQTNIFRIAHACWSKKCLGHRLRQFRRHLFGHTHSPGKQRRRSNHAPSGDRRTGGYRTLRINTLGPSFV